jgi:hypothetical protein
MINTFAIFISLILSACDANFNDGPVSVGDKVKVKNGYYQGCEGVVKEEVFNTLVKDRFIGFNVELDCKERSGKFFFTEDFLKRKKEIYFNERKKIESPAEEDIRED